MFASVPDEDQATYPDGWSQAKLSELHDAVQQMFAQMAADQHPSATEDTILRETPFGKTRPRERVIGRGKCSPTSPHPQTISSTLTLPPATPSQGGVGLQPSPDWGTTSQAPTQSARWEGRSNADTSRYINVSLTTIDHYTDRLPLHFPAREHLVLERDVEVPARVSVAMGKALGDTFPLSNRRLRLYSTHRY